VTPEHFNEQLQLLRRHYTPMSLETLGQCFENGSTPVRAVVITFDDAIRAPKTDVTGDQLNVSFSPKIKWLVGRHHDLLGG
jgi:hypothetical protein